MAIGTDDAILKFGTQDTVTTGTPGTIASAAYSVSGDTADWTNDDDAIFAAAVLKLQFDTTAPTVGNVELYCQVLNIQSTNDPGAPDDSYKHTYLGTFVLDFGVAADVDYYTTLRGTYFNIPMFQTSQVLHFYIKNVGTSQTIGSDWALYITPLAEGPHA